MGIFPLAEQSHPVDGLSANSNLTGHWFTLVRNKSEFSQPPPWIQASFHMVGKLHLSWHKSHSRRFDIIKTSLIFPRGYIL